MCVCMYVCMYVCVYFIISAKTSSYEHCTHSLSLTLSLSYSNLHLHLHSLSLSYSLSVESSVQKQVRMCVNMLSVLSDGGVNMSLVLSEHVVSVEWVCFQYCLSMYSVLSEWNHQCKNKFVRFSLLSDLTLVAYMCVGIYVCEFLFFLLVCYSLPMYVINISTNVAKPIWTKSAPTKTSCFFTKHIVLLPSQDFNNLFYYCTVCST